MDKIKFDYQFLFVKFPIIFPLIYAFVLYQFPAFETELIIITILLLAETHFGATWPFMVDKKNQEMIRIKKFEFTYIPIVILLLSLFCFFSFKKEFLLFFFLLQISTM